MKWGKFLSKLKKVTQEAIENLTTPICIKNTVLVDFKPNLKENF